MAKSFLGQKRLRKYYGKIREVVEMPNLIEVQKSSYDLFLKSGDKLEPIDGEGIKGVFQSVFPIKDFNETAILEFVKYDLEKAKYDVEECQQRDMTYAAPLKVTLRLIVFDIDEDTGARSVKDIKEQDVFMGDMPLMTPNGTFVVNGTERVIVSQMHRSPGVFFDHDKGKSHSSGKLLFACRIIPYRGSWLDFEFDAKDIVYARIDRRRKLPVTTLLYALGYDQEGIMGAYSEIDDFKLGPGQLFSLKKCDSGSQVICSFVGTNRKLNKFYDSSDLLFVWTESVQTNNRKCRMLKICHFVILLGQNLCLSGQSYWDK